MNEKEKLIRWKKKVIYYHYLESLGWKLNNNAWIDIWKYHPDNDEGLEKSFKELFGD